MLVVCPADAEMLAMVSTISAGLADLLCEVLHLVRHDGEPATRVAGSAALGPV